MSIRPLYPFVSVSTRADELCPERGDV